MGAPGRKPKPTAVKIASGNPGRRPLNMAEPQLGPADVRVPNGKLSREAQKLWRTLAPRLAAAGVLQAGDLPALEMLCMHYAVARMALDEMWRDGQVKNEQGKVISEGYAVSTPTTDSIKKHPAASVWRENSMAFKAYATEFGLTPSSRVRIKTDGHEREKTLAELLFEGAGDE